MRLSSLADAAAHEDGVLRISKNTLQGVYKSTESRLLRFFGDVQIEDLEVADIAGWCEDLEGSALAIRTANTYKRTAQAMLNRCGYGHLTSAIHQRKAPPRKSKAMTREHFGKLVRHANVRDAAILWLLRDSGRRRSTICHLKAADTRIYQGPQGDFRIVNSFVIEKGMTPVVVFGGEDPSLAVSLLLRCRPDPDSPWLFTHLKSGDPLRPNTVSQIFRDLRRRAGLPSGVPASAHSLRHWFAQRKLEEFDVKLVAQWMGISKDTVLEVYATRSLNELERLYYGDE